uniref:Uncharacterized protein n=1 Tax=Tetranychus urticae TaxID=32264 RepID=T1KQE2_TETUR
MRTFTFQLSRIGELSYCIRQMSLFIPLEVIKTQLLSKHGSC